MALIYIHGFNSSPASLKARQTADWLSINAPDITYICPALSSKPDLAIEQLYTLIENASDPVGLIGSSMGGYYAAWLAEKYDLKAVLVNPAVRPYEFMLEYLGENANYHTGERYLLEPKHVDIAKSLEVASLKNPKNYWVLLQTGDEVLDYRHAEARYADCDLVIEKGGDHSFQHFERHLPATIDFLQLSPKLSPKLSME
ncbi:MAG: YqiA/YcfP family alpha/beta fold hydrolase [Porticoccus sp.]